MKNDVKNNISKNKKKIMIQPDAGLGNRLYCLYSALYYAGLTNSDFDLIWLRENCCNVPLEKIIDLKSLPKGMKLHRTYHLGYKSIYCIPTVISNIYMKLVKSFYEYYTSEDTRVVYKSSEEMGFVEMFSDNKRRICIKANGVFFNTEHFGSVRDIIKPAPVIINRVNEIMGDYTRTSNVNLSGNSGIPMNVSGHGEDASKGKRTKDDSQVNSYVNANSHDGETASERPTKSTPFIRAKAPDEMDLRSKVIPKIENVRTIGIHIRRTDNKMAIEGSPTESFKILMGRLEKENPNTWFYLATDDEELEAELKYKFKVIPHATFSDTKARDNVESIKDAYVDMLCLSRCDKIYGSYGSSFSEMAALIGGIELVRVGENV